MCKRCSELEQEIEAAEEYGFGLTSWELQLELDDLMSSHLPNNACNRPASAVGMQDESDESAGG